MVSIKHKTGMNYRVHVQQLGTRSFSQPLLYVNHLLLCTNYDEYNYTERSHWSSVAGL